MVEYNIVSVENYLELRNRCFAEIDAKRSTDEKLVTVASMQAKFTKAYSRRTEDEMRVRIWDVSNQHLEVLFEAFEACHMRRVCQQLEAWDNNNHEQNLAKWKVLNSVTRRALTMAGLTKNSVFGIEEDFECSIDITTPDHASWLVADLSSLDRDFKRHYNAVAGRDPNSTSSGGYSRDYIEEFRDAQEAMLRFGVQMPAAFSQKSKNNKKPRWINCFSGLGDGDLADEVKTLHDAIMTRGESNAAMDEYRRAFKRDGVEDKGRASQFFSNQHGRNPLILLPSFLHYICGIELEDFAEAFDLMSSVMMSHSAKQKDIIAGLSKTDNPLGGMIASHLKTNELDLYSSPLHYSPTRLRVDLACFTKSPSWYVLTVLPPTSKMLFTSLMHALEKRAGLGDPKQPHFSYTMNARTSARNYESPLKCTSFMLTNRYVATWLFKDGEKFQVGIKRGKFAASPVKAPMPRWQMPNYGFQQPFFAEPSRVFSGFPYLPQMRGESDFFPRNKRERERWLGEEREERSERNFPHVGEEDAMFVRPDWEESRRDLDEQEGYDKRSRYEEMGSSGSRFSSEQPDYDELPLPELNGLRNPEVLKREAAAAIQFYRR